MLEARVQVSAALEGQHSNRGAGHLVVVRA